MAKYVKWTSEERALIVNTIASFMKANGKTMADFQSPGWFSYYMNQGQQFLPEERRRRIASPMMASWIESGLRVALGEGPETQVLTQEQVNRLVHANLAAVITALQSTHVVVEKSLHFQMATQSRTGKATQDGSSTERADRRDSTQSGSRPEFHLRPRPRSAVLALGFDPRQQHAAERRVLRRPRELHGSFHRQQVARHVPESSVLACGWWDFRS